jgi:hypothetical protein
MPASGPRPGQVAVQVSLAAIFVSLELSRSTWLITSLVPGGADKMSKHSVRSGDVAKLMAHLAKLRDKAHVRAGASFPIIAIQEAGLDGFWVHRVLERAGIESHVVDAASILTSRRRRIGHLHIPTPYTEYGMKSMGEGGAVAPPAAIANAVRDALAGIGAEVNETPITPRRVLTAIKAARAAASSKLWHQDRSR